MRELTRSNDPVFLSYLSAQLAGEGIDVLMLDAFAASVLAPMNATAMQRVMVAEEDYWPAWVVLGEAEQIIREDTLLGGKVRLLQPENGFRAAIDPVLLAACVPAGNGDRVLDIGTGTGVAALCLMARVPWAWVAGIDVQPELIAIAEANARRNGIAERARFRAADIRGETPAADFDHVMTNPPYMRATAGQRPKTEAKRLATVESTVDLAGWVRFAAESCRAGGTVSMVHRAERVDEILSAFGASGLGAAAVLELIPVDDGRPLKRAIVQGIKGAAQTAPDRHRLVLHRAEGGYTPETAAVLRDAHALTISETMDNGEQA